MKLLAWVGLVASLVLGACGDDGGGDDSQEKVEVDAPAGWQEVPLTSLGFGLALPGDWEAIVLDEEGLGVLERSDPEVPGFATSAHAAQQSGAVLYAAGRDKENEDQVNDLKVLADTSSEVEDLAGLEDYARAMVSANDLDNATLTPVEDAPEPTVDVRYQATGEVRPDDSGNPDEAEDSEPDGEAAEADETENDDIVVEGVQRFVLAPSGAVYMFVIAGEDAASVDELAPQLLATVTLAS